MKVLWLSYRISASVIINALLVFSVDRFNRVTNYHGNIVWYALKVWTFLTPQLVTVSHYQSRSCSSSIRMRKKKDWRAAKGLPNTVKSQRKIEQFDTSILKIVEPITENSACLEIPQYQNSRPQLQTYRMKICQTR